MKIESLGFVEVRGAANAIAVADAMIKASNVRILSESRLDPGQVTIIVEGDLGACHAAIDIGAEVARQNNCLVGVLLKGKPDAAIEALFQLPPDPAPAPPAPSSPPTPPVPPTAAGPDNPPVRPRRAMADPSGTASDAQAAGPAVAPTAALPPAAQAPLATGDGAAEPVVAAVAPVTAQRRSFPADDVLAFIAANEKGRTVVQIAREFKVGTKAARQWVSELVEQEKVERYNRGIRVPAS